MEGTAGQKIFNSRSKALKKFILFKINFSCIKSSVIQLFFILRLLMKTGAKDFTEKKDLIDSIKLEY